MNAAIYKRHKRTFAVLALAGCVLVSFLAGVQVGSFESQPHPQLQTRPFVLNRLVGNEDEQQLTTLIPAADGTEAIQTVAPTALFVHAPVKILQITDGYGAFVAGPVESCFMDGQPLQCHVFEKGTISEAEVDCMWFHIPNMPKETVHEYYWKHQQSPDQFWPALAGYSTESCVWYRSLDDPDFMAKFDITETYRREADIWDHYDFYREEYMQPPAVVFADKQDALVFLHNECGALNGRQNIIQELMDMLPVHAYGNCLYNMLEPYKFIEDKIALFKGYKFCSAFENSNTYDYVTEKLYESFAAGCVPIYWGAPNVVEDYLPSPDSVVLYDPAVMTVQQLGAELLRLMYNQTAYAEKLAWKQKPLQQLNLNFVQWLASSKGSVSAPWCRMCQAVAKRRDSRSSSSSSGSGGGGNSSSSGSSKKPYPRCAEGAPS